MTTPAQARAAVRRSGVAVADWAHVLGVSRSGMYKLIESDPAMQAGPLMARLLGLLDALEAGRVTWQRLPSGRRGGRPYHRLAGGVRFTSAPSKWHADFLHQRLVRAPPNIEVPGTIEAVPTKKWFERGSG